MFIVKVEKLRHVNEVNDIAIEFVCYLTCDDGAVYKNTDGSFKYFTIRVPKSITDEEMGTLQQLITAALNVIRDDFQITRIVTDAAYSAIVEETGAYGTNIVRFSENDVKRLCVGMSLVGPGYTNWPFVYGNPETTDPVIESISNKQDVIVSRNLYFMFYGCTIDPNIVYSDLTIVEDSFEINLPELPPDWVLGATITGSGVPANTSIVYINKTTNTIQINQKLTATVNPGSITIFTNPNSKYIFIRNTPEISQESVYKDIVLSGFGIPKNTIVLSTNKFNDENIYTPLGDSNCLKLSNSVNIGTTIDCSSTTLDQIFSFSNMTFSAYILPNGDPSDPWNASNIDFTDLLRAASIIDFTEL